MSGIFPGDDQAVLFECDDQAALLLSREDLERSKRYTAEQTRNIEWKRNAIILLLASDWPVEHIERALHVNSRTVRAIAARCAGEVAGSAKTFARVCGGLAARWAGLAKTREHEASFLQLVTGAGIMVDKSILLDSMGQMADIDETKETPDRAAAMAALRARMVQIADQAGADQVAKSDSPSDAKPQIAGHNPGDSPDDAPCDAPGAPSDPPSEPPASQAEEPQAGPGGGGGRQAAGPVGSPMGQPERELQQSDPGSGSG